MNLFVTDLIIRNAGCVETVSYSSWRASLSSARVYSVLSQASPTTRYYKPVALNAVFECEKRRSTFRCSVLSSGEDWMQIVYAIIRETCNYLTISSHHPRQQDFSPLQFHRCRPPLPKAVQTRDSQLSYFMNRVTSRTDSGIKNTQQDYRNWSLYEGGAYIYTSTYEYQILCK